MVAKTDPDFDQYERDIAEFFAAGKKEGASKLEKRKVANKSRSLDLREEQQAAQRRREERSLQQSAPQVEAPDAPKLSAPTFSSGSGNAPLGIGSGGPSRETSARIIIVIIVVSAVGTVAHDAIVGGAVTGATTVKVGNGTVKVPTHLRTLGAVLIMGTIALVVNEFDPGIGLILGLALGFDVALNTFVGSGPNDQNSIFGRLRGGIFGSGTQSASSSGVVSSGIVEPGFAAAGGGNAKTGPFTQYQTAPVGSVQSHQPGQTTPEKASSWLNIFGL